MSDKDFAHSVTTIPREPTIPVAPPRIHGLGLRELLVLILLDQRTPMTVSALVAAVEYRGFRIQGRPGKVVSDQLRYEVARERVEHCGRGVYAAGIVTRQARWRMQRWIAALRIRDQGRSTPPLSL